MTEANDKTPVGGGSVAAPDERVKPEAIKAIPVRHYGRWVSSVVVLFLLAAIVLAFSRGQIEWSVVGEYINDGTVIRGAWATLQLTLYAMLIGVVLGMVLAVMRLSQNPVLRNVAWGYIWFFRGTPVLVQLFLWFNLSLVFTYVDLGPIYKNEMTDVMTPFMAALLGLGLNEAAYMAEIGRAGIQSVDRGQTEAAHALGMSPAKTTRRIVLPQAMRVIIPPTGNEFINMLKTSSLAYVIGFSELFLVSREVGSVNLAVMELLIVVTIWYLILTTIFSIGQYYLERHFARGSDRALPPTPLQKIRANVLSFRRQAGPGGVGA
ncbi:amino acid ABC transporter permease [Streptomyces alkaliterrae]|uniref:ABC transporter permease subunit n=1 Tax=Streptomyces alkaliterrae TaxID=2213162 RepID=A0A5P0YPF5_9ACTN|nr:amino acid ABC transporter permease [Streptomyces alkaliterrae]MBB1258619.1 amino acid ABC transporter permease [Streptomyces alkaliterrae]MQS01790.1 ABC transporter permease subunit [Streptomyces alkaliterrae]